MPDQQRTSTRAPVYLVYPGYALGEELDEYSKAYPPFGLASVVAFAKMYDGGTLSDRYDFLSPFIADPDLLATAYREYGVGLFLFSNYVWSESSNLRIARAVKQWSPDNLAIMGGPSVPVSEHGALDFLNAHEQVDVCVRGEGELTFAEMLLHIREPFSGSLASLRSVEGARLSVSQRL
jgi:radical SAM superfamily enzyme YgiQ (UPF0313 family)